MYETIERTSTAIEIMELTSSPSVYRVVKYDGLFTESVCYTFSIETAMSTIERQIDDYKIGYPRSRVKRLWDRSPPVVVLTLIDSTARFVREWQYTIIKLRVLE